MTRSQDGVAVAMSRRPNRIVVGLVLLIGLSLAWYWISHDRLMPELSVDGSRTSPAAQSMRAHA